MSDYYRAIILATRSSARALSGNREHIRIMGWPVRYSIRYCTVSRRDAVIVATH